MTFQDQHKLRSLEVDRSLLNAGSADRAEDCRRAIDDLVDDSRFCPYGEENRGPFDVELMIDSGRLVFEVTDAQSRLAKRFVLSLTALRPIINAYFEMCDSYYAAIVSLPPDKIEAMDMARRGLHNDGSEKLIERLEGKINLDFETARRFFTLICALVREGALA